MGDTKCCGNCRNVDFTINYTSKSRSYLRDVSTNKSIFYIKCLITRAYHNINDKNKCFK